MKQELAEFEPLEMQRALDLREVINRAAREQKAVVVDPDEGGVIAAASTDLISPSENTNALVRYQRHY